MIRKIKVFIVDDHPMVIEGMVSMIQKEPSIELVGYAMNAASCLGYFLQHSADVVLMDINLPDKSGIELCKELKERKPEIAILAISSFNQGSYVKQMMEQGASGYIFKNVSREEFVLAVTKVASGQHYLNYEAGFAMREEKKRTEQLPVLTKREKEVLQLIADGLTNPQIAEKLFISQSTVDSHRKSVMTKLKVKNTAALLKFCVENELIKVR
jgi:DNA-binding NarL/FixJ family response regulator